METVGTFNVGLSRLTCQQSSRSLTTLAPLSGASANKRTTWNETGFEFFDLEQFLNMALSYPPFSRPPSPSPHLLL